MALVQIDLTMGAPSISGSLFAISHAYTIREVGGGALVDIFEDGDGAVPADNPISAIDGELRFWTEEGQSLERVDEETGLIRSFFTVGPGAYAIGGTDATTIHGNTIPVPGPSEDGFTWVYDDSTGAFIWVEPPSGGGSDPVEALHDLTPRMTMTDWSDYDAGLTFYKDRERVYFQGVVSADVAGTTVLVNSLPAGYCPTTRNIYTQLHTSYDSTSVATRGHFWEVSIIFSGQIAFKSNPSFSASPNFGKPPVGTVFDLDDLSFRIN